MSWGYYPQSLSVGERRALAEKQAAKMAKAGRTLEPVGNVSQRGNIATSFWGQSWCKHLESFSDYASRLPRGRSYVRNGSVIHLRIEPGTISAMVQGSQLYEATIRVEPLPRSKWKCIQDRCRGRIGSLIELLHGKISGEIMGVVANKTDGLFPSPGEIKFNCNCPDWVDMCKHIAAVLYGVGVRLDTQPELLFKLRGADHNELISAGDAADAIARPGAGGPTANPAGVAARRRFTPTSLNQIFGIDLEALEPQGEAPLPTTEQSAATAPATTTTTAPAPVPKAGTAGTGPAKLNPKSAAAPLPAAPADPAPLPAPPRRGRPRKIDTAREKKFLSMRNPLDPEHRILTPRQQEFLLYIQHYIVLNRRSPSEAEMQRSPCTP
ncbi:hypothetical protein DB346_07745 [Verrucomicrobia bacterium LW23]|nr:hypothetical protein DB346_07745 [Verrucomicrobia bacterium LW23]